MVETLQSITEALQANPVVFSLIMAVGLLLIYFKYWLIGRAARKALRDKRAGLAVDAAVGQVRHETGVGLKEVLVMRPVKLVAPAFWCLLFFGGGAVFYALVVLQEPDVSHKDWGVFAILSVFAFGAILIFGMATTRIRFDGEEIRRTGLLVRNFRRRMADLTLVEPLRKSWLAGMKLHFQDGAKLNVASNMSGYRQLMQQISGVDPKLRLVAKMLSNTAKGQA